MTALSITEAVVTGAATIVVAWMTAHVERLRCRVEELEAWRLEVEHREPEGDEC